MTLIQSQIAARLWAALLALLALTLAPAVYAAPKAKTANVEITLVADKAEAAPGDTVNIAFVQRIRPGWHTYWRNPGDAGEPTRINWTLPKGYSVGDIIWPAPERIPVGPLANYGFKGEVRLVSPLTVPKTAKPGDLAQIKASATWQVCEEVCIPEGASVDLVIRIAAQGKADPQGAALVQSALDAAPKLVEWPASFDPASAVLSVQSPELAQVAQKGELRGVAFYPYDQAMIDPAPEQKVQVGGQGVTLTLPVQPGFAVEGEAIEGLLTYETRGGYGWKRQHVLLKAPLGAALPGTSGAPLISPQQSAAPGGGDAAGFGLALLLAFAGGLILNLMPCVFPILSIKALSLTKAAHGHATEMRAQGLAFLGGVLLTFAILGGALIALKAGGAAIGWGFQLQSPLIVGALVILFFALALNLLGAFDIAGAFQGLGGNLADRGGALGAFFTGALAVVVATPCTAPFMGAALGYGLTAPAWQSLAIFLALGLGLAAPFTALAFAPALARSLPRPGPWMTRFKEFLAFPMLAA
ncbi:MAG: protein-disulfide reductase DsbD domain-containing protein, partial [Caulobacterales bacterium]